MSIKLLGPKGVKKLTTDIKQMKAALGGDIQKLAELLSASVQKTGEALDAKQDAPLCASCTISVSGWSTDNVSGYPKYFDISVQGVTAKDRAQVTLSPASLGIASNCGLCCTCETLDGKIRLRAKSIPTAAMTAEYWVERKESN